MPSDGEKMLFPLPVGDFRVGNVAPKGLRSIGLAGDIEEKMLGLLVSND